jgi:hypothetical protein
MKYDGIEKMKFLLADFVVRLLPAIKGVQAIGTKDIKFGK